MITFVLFSSLLSLVFLARETESAAILSQPPNPVRVLEGQPLKLEWAFSVQGRLRRLELELSGATEALVEITPASTFILPDFESRVTANLTGTNVTITFSSVNRTDGADYYFKVFGSPGSITVPLKVKVEYPPSLITRAQDQVVLEGDPAINLTCSPDGEPLPNITWTKVFANGTDSDVLFTGEQFILPNNRTNDGTYRCKARNGIGNDVNHTVNVVVNFKPEITFTVKSRNESICRGDTINITCSAVGKPVIHTYQLFKDGTQVHASNNSVLFWRQNTTAGGETVYTCVANNTVAVANTTKAITVGVPSSIQSILDKVVTEGDNVTLTCNASGIPTQVSWINVRSGNRTYKNVLELKNISRHEAGEYRCDVRNPCRNATESATIEVQFKPEMVQLVTSERTICQGDIISLNCTANSNPAIHTYQLYVNGTMVNEASSTGVWNRTMTTGGVFVYKCMVNNTVGTAMSMDVFVTVNVPSSIQSIPDKVVTEGDNVTLICNASGIPTQVSWINVRSGNHTHGNVLEIENVSRHEAGEYRCEARNPCRNATESVTIDVQYAPEITNISARQTLNRGEMLTPYCVADGNPAPTITWTRLSTGNVVNMPFPVTGKEHEGDYRCTASNRIGNDTKDISVTVNLPAVAVASADKNTVQKGGNVSLFCSVSGTPTPSVVWTHVDTGNKHYNEIWIISDITFNDLGEYRCDAINIYGNDTNSTFILFKGGKCEEGCKDGRTCRSGLGTIPLCLCEEGKTGEKCEENESAENLFEAGLEFLMEFKDVYNDLENPERKTLTTKIEAAVKDELNGTGLTQVHVVSLRRGSVIADLELRFNRSIYQDSLRELLQDATRDNKLGDLEVKDVVVFGEFFPTEAPTEPPAYLIYATVVGVLVLIIASGAVYVIIKRKRRGREVKLLEERETVKESHFNLNIEDGRDNEGSIDAVNRAHYMELYEITDSHGTYSEINEYAPLNPATRSWEVSRENVTIKKVICKGAFGQVAQGTVQNLPLEKGITTVALKMLKETHQHEDYDTKLYENVEDLMS